VYEVVHFALYTPLIPYTAIECNCTGEVRDVTRTADGNVPDEIRLADFIRLNIESIVAEWISFARTRTPASDDMTKLALKDHIVEILHFIADDLESPQTKTEQVAKSQGRGMDDTPLTQTAAEVHAELRLSDGFDIDQMVSEYRALRASVVKQWVARHPALAATDLEDLTRFNEAIDQAMTESVAQYTKMITRSRNIFLGVLGHDLRNPIGAASMAAQRMVKMGDPAARQTMLASEIVNATGRGLTILNDLLYLTRSTFGMDIPIAKKRFDLGDLGQRIVEECRSIADDRPIQISVKGNTMGTWDEARLGQVFSNLIGNAIQYGRAGSAIDVYVEGDETEVQLSVRNEGDPISPQKLQVIFEPMTRGQSGDQQDLNAHLGLGLFIARKIVAAHGGKLEVTSSAVEGTKFTVNIPR
jgi:signal transduction histidine kinase